MRDRMKNEGSITLEATLILPFFIAFIIVMVVIVKLLIMQIALQTAVSETCKQVCTHYYPVALVYDGCIDKSVDAAAGGLSKLLDKNQYGAYIPDFIKEPIENKVKDTAEGLVSDLLGKTLGEVTTKIVKDNIIQGMVEEYADRDILPDQINVELTHIPPLSPRTTEDAYFGIEATYRVDLGRSIPFFGKDKVVILKARAGECVWIGQ